MGPRILERRVVYSGYLSVERFMVRLADGAEVVREVEFHGEAVAVLPYDPRRRMAMTVSLLRIPAFDRFGEIALEEACAGMIDSGDAPDSARREAMEELGLRLGALEFVGCYWPSPGASGERVSLFLAPYEPADRLHDGGGVEHEHEGITVIERPLTTLADDADAGRLVDLKLLALVQTLRLRRPDLFAA